MDVSLKQRLVGAVVLIALAVIFLPMLVKGPAPDSGVSDVSLTVPPEPKEANGMFTQDLPLIAPSGVPEGGVSGMPDTVAGQPAEAAPAAAGLFPAVAAGDFAVSFGSYASAADADKVIDALRSAELPGYREAVSLNGRQAQRVRIGPFADRAVAESARLRAAHVRDDVQASVIALNASADVATASKPVPAPTPEPAKPEPLPVAKPAEPKAVAKVEPKPEPKPATQPAKPEPPAAKPVDTSKTGFAVQVGAFADAAAATALRDKLRGAGFNAFTDTVNTDAGKRTRVRVGPVVSRADADALKSQVRAKAGVDGFVRPHP